MGSRHGQRNGAETGIPPSEQVALERPDEGARFNKRGHGGNLREGHPGVDEDGHAAQLKDGEKRDIKIAGHGNHENDSVTRLEAKAFKAGGGSVRRGPKILERKDLFIHDQGRSVGRALGRGF